MLKELLAGAWEARTMIPRLVLEFDQLHASFVALLERLDRWEKANAELRAEVDALKAPPPKAASAPKYKDTHHA